MGRAASIIGPGDLPNGSALPISWRMTMTPDTDPKPVPTDVATPKDAAPSPEAEIGGPKERDPTRYGDWTVKGRCIDF